MKILPLKFLLCLVSSVLITNFGYTSDKDDKPNILIIMADDCTYSDLPLYGGKNVLTPQIDKLASQGITFNKAYVTMSMCVPCRAELYTGMQPARNGVCWNHASARKGVKSIVHYLGEMGYRTGIAGKVHATPKEVFPFELVEGIERSCVSETANYDGNKLSEFISRDSDQPFCLVTALVVPHIPWTVGNPAHFDAEKLELPTYLADTKETRENFALYLAEIEVLDQQVGLTMDLLKEAGVEDNTIVIFTSEQGAQLPFCKWTNWEMGVHTGFIVRWPGKIQPGNRTDALIQYADVLPTLIDAIGGKHNSDFDGSSFLPVLLGKKDNHRQYAFFMHNNVPEGPPYPIRSITDGTHHYIRNLNHTNLYLEKHLTGRMPLNNYWSSWMFDSAKDTTTLNLVTRYMLRPDEELYHTPKDPFEMENLAEKNELSLVKNSLSEQLDKWMRQQGDPGAEIDSWEEWNNSKKGKHFNIER